MTTSLYGPRVRSLALAGLVFVAGCSSSTPPPAADSGPAAATDEAPLIQLLKDPVDVPAFTVRDIDGKTISLADLKGKVVLVNFWATWCPPCRAEIPDLVKLQDKYRDKLVIVGISEDEVDPAQVKAFATEQKMNYPIVMATTELRQIFKGVAALPTTFVLDTDGKIQMRHVGMLDPERTDIETRYLSGELKNAKVERVEDETKALLTKAAQAKEIPGIDLTKLTPEQRTDALKALNAENCTCGCELTLAACRINDPSCGVSLPIAQKLVERIAKGEKPAAVATTQQ